MTESRSLHTTLSLTDRSAELIEWALRVGVKFTREASVRQEYADLLDYLAERVMVGRQRRDTVRQRNGLAQMRFRERQAALARGETSLPLRHAGRPRKEQTG